MPFVVEYIGLLGCWENLLTMQRLVRTSASGGLELEAPTSVRDIWVIELG